MNAKEFIESEIKKDSHLKVHIERMDAVQQLELIGLMERYASKLHQPTVSGQCECDFSIESRQGVDFVRCVNCGDTYYKK